MAQYDDPSAVGMDPIDPIGQDAIPPGYRRNPETGQLEPIPPYEDSTTPGQTPWAPGSTTPSSSPPGYHWDPLLANFVPNDPVSGGDESGNTGSPDGSLFRLGQPGTLTAPFMGSFTPPTPGGIPSWLPQVPGLTLPTFPGYKPYTSPSASDVESDPGYKFSREQGLTGVQQSAAARGLLNSGGTLKDIAQWGTDYAGTRYNDVDTRNRNNYVLNYATQVLDPYKHAYQSALDLYAPQMTGWSTGVSAAQRQNEGDYSNAYNSFLFDFNKFRDQRDSTFDKAFALTTA